MYDMLYNAATILHGNTTNIELGSYFGCIHNTTFNSKYFKIKSCFVSHVNFEYIAYMAFTLNFIIAFSLLSYSIYWNESEINYKSLLRCYNHRWWWIDGHKTCNLGGFYIRDLTTKYSCYELEVPFYNQNDLENLLLNIIR